MALVTDFRAVSDNAIEQLADRFDHLPRPLLAAIGAGDLAVEQRGVVPVHGDQGAGGDVLRDRVQLDRDRVGRRLRPVRGEDVIGPATQQQRVQPTDVLGDRLRRLLVPVGRLPAAVAETAPRGPRRALPAPGSLRPA